MNYNFLWASTITNVTINIKSILEALNISQGKFLRCLGYSAKSSFITKKHGATSSDFVISQMDLSKNLKKQEQYDALSKEQKKRLEGKQLLEDIEQYFATVKNRERFADMLIMAIDSFLLFDNKSEDVFKQIAVASLYNKELIDNRPVYILGQLDLVIDDILQDKKAIITDDIRNKIEEYKKAPNVSVTESEYERCILEIQYSKLSSQPWFKMDFKNQRGLSYQFQYFKYARLRDYHKHNNRNMFEKIMQEKEGILPIITGTGFLKLHPAIPTIIKALSDMNCCRKFWVEDKPILRFPSSSISGIYYENFSTASFENHCQLIKLPDEMPHADFEDFGSWSIETDPRSYPVQEEAACIESCFQENGSLCSYLLIFVGNINEIPLLASYLDPETCQKTIFAAPSQTDASYISFTYQGKTYNYAFRIA